MKNYFLLLIMLLSLQTVFGQDWEKKREKVESAKVAHITKELDLSVEEAQAFWPVYNKYQDQMRAMFNKRERPPKMDEMSDDEAKKMIADHFEKEKMTLELKQQMYGELTDVLPPNKLVKLHFAEKKFRHGLLERIKKGKDKRERKR